MEGEFIVHIPEELVNRGGVSTGSVASISSRGSTISAQMVYDNNSTISSTGSYQLQHPNDWHAGSVSSWDSVAGSGSLSSTESWDSQSAPLGSGPMLVQQIPSPLCVRAEAEYRQNRSGAHYFRHPIGSHSNRARLISMFRSEDRQREVINKKQVGMIDKEQGGMIDKEQGGMIGQKQGGTSEDEQGEMIEEDQSDKQAANQTGEQKVSIEAVNSGEDKVSIDEFIAGIAKTQQMMLGREFHEILLACLLACLLMCLLALTSMSTGLFTSVSTSWSTSMSTSMSTSVY